MLQHVVSVLSRMCFLQHRHLAESSNGVFLCKYVSTYFLGIVKLLANIFCPKRTKKKKNPKNPPQPRKEEEKHAGSALVFRIWSSTVCFSTIKFLSVKNKCLFVKCSHQIEMLSFQIHVPDVSRCQIHSVCTF